MFYYFYYTYYYGDDDDVDDVDCYIYYPSSTNNPGIFLSSPLYLLNFLIVIWGDTNPGLYILYYKSSPISVYFDWDANIALRAF